MIFRRRRDRDDDRTHCQRRRFRRLFPLLTGAVLLLGVSPGAGRDFDRWIHLEGVDNFRDIGAYDAGTTAMVAPGRVFRSANLCFSVLSGLDLTTTDAAIIESLGIGLIIDLRLEDQRILYPDSTLLDAFTTHVMIPIAFPGGIDEPAELYRQILLLHGEQWRQVFDVLADPGHFPLNYHCQAGKDRAGILTALLLTFLGVDREDVVSDYLFTNIAYGMIITDRTYIEAVLDEIASQGGADSYLESIGVGQAIRESVRANLLVPRPAVARSAWWLY